MASANSRGDSEGCGRGFIQAATATLVVSCVLVCVLLSAPEQLLGMFQNDAEVLALAKTYCMIRCVLASTNSRTSIITQQQVGTISYNWFFVAVL